MWLLPAFPAVAALSTRTFYRLHVTGPPVPSRGPALLVANHPNALLDPFLVIGAAGRPVRFLAKAPLLSDPLIGWGVRAVGALPVYRRKEDPTQMVRNEETFRAVHDALGNGAAVGIFPEGISHDNPSLVPLKTGAARIALGAVPVTKGDFPIIPIGLVFEAKQEFRSTAFVVIGDPVHWSDLVHRGADDHAAVRELTGRIQSALHQVTLNLASHDDAALVAAATAIYGVEVEPAGSGGVEAARRITAARALTRLSLDGDDAAVEVSQRLRRHMRTLAVLSLSPADVHRRRDARSAAQWTLARISPAALLRAITAAAGTVAFWPPYRATAWVASRGETADIIATLKLLYGGVLFLAWIALLAIGLGLWLGWPVALLSLVVLPVLALRTLSYSERWTAAARDVRSFFTRRSLATLEQLRQEQRELGRDLHALYQRVRDSLDRTPAAGTPAG